MRQFLIDPNSNEPHWHDDIYYNKINFCDCVDIPGELKN